MKRFYKQALVSRQEGSFGVELDGRPVKTPAGKLLLCDNEKLAQYVADEWQAQNENILPDAMPVNQLVITTIDATRERSEIERHILDFIDTDLLYYRADTSPYKEKQDEIWGCWTGWFSDKFGTQLKITRAIESLEQEVAAHAIFSDYISRLNKLELTIFESIVEDTSSPLLALAFFEKAASVDDLFGALFLDDLIRAEIYNEAQYGAAPDQEKKRKTVKENLSAAEKILNS